MVAVTTEKMNAQIDGPIGWVVFNNPARRNAVSMEMWQAIPAIFAALEAEPAVRVIVLRGAGDKAFVSGLDIAQFADEFYASAAAAGRAELAASASRRIHAARKPTLTSH